MENKIDSTIELAMERAFRDHFLGGSDVKIFNAQRTEKKKNKIFTAVKTMTSRSYWTLPNTVETIGFSTKIAIIFPGLLFGQQFWWLYIFAILSSVALIWSSTAKTLPTIILFNVAWVCLASLSIIKHFWW